MKEIRELKRRYVYDNGVIEKLIGNKCDISDTLAIDSLKTMSAIDDCEFGNKFFLAFDGALRQFVIKKQVFFPFNFTYLKIRSLVQLEVCGIGKIWVDCKPNLNSFGELPFDCFETIEDYKIGNTYEVNYTIITPYRLAKIFFRSGVCNFTKTDTNYRASLYKWDGVKCVRCDVRTNVSLCVIWDGYLDIPFEKAKHPYYVSEEDCIANNSLRVECFSDNEESEVEEETYLTFNVEGEDTQNEEENYLTFKIKSKDVQKVINFVDSLQKK